eukprot:2400066-Pyramimonas_sp.AAC.1
MGQSPGLAAVAGGVTKDGAESQNTTRHSVPLHSRGTRGAFAQSETEVPFVTASACPARLVVAGLEEDSQPHAETLESEWTRGAERVC